MAFGFFKKSETADVIFTGGKIFTQNSDFPWVEAVACKDGLVLDVGDYEDLSELEGKHTEIIDLEGGVMLPGYIDVCGHSAMGVFQKSCLFLKDGGLEDILSQISEYASAREDAGILFAYGFDEKALEGTDADQRRTLLDEICDDKPVVILGKSGFQCIVNTLALETVKVAAEEDGINAVSISYLLGILEPIDLNTLPESVPVAMADYCERGFTAVFDCGAPDYFASLYQNIMVHLYQEEMLKQRFYGSLLINRDVNPKVVMHRLSQFRTNCVELDDHMKFDTLSLVVEGEEDSLSVSEEVLRALCLDAGDKGFDVHIDARGEAAVDAAVAAISATRSAGYKKNAFTLIHDPSDGSRDLTDTCYQLDVTESVHAQGIPHSGWSCIENAKNIEEAVELLTVNAAVQLGISGGYGSIEKGKHADFVIFDENPFELAALSDFIKLKATKTVIDGVIVYNAREDDPASWHAMLTEQEEE